MKAISQGDNTFDIYDNSLRVYEQLPPQSYVVRFAERRGFFLSRYSDMEISERKIYGVHTDKVEKIMNSFKDISRNLGVILSGDKGIGKSLFAKMLSIKCIENGMPVIVVDTYTPGIASYLESIEQEVMVLFDEFDKTFGEVTSRDGEASPQTGLLSLFDGISVGKKLFVVTCNEIYKLNAYLINRPGRFHYHLRFEYPSASEIRQYLLDNVSPEYQMDVEKVISFSGKVSLNYDCLRAISFELNHGYSFEDAIKDLNIVNFGEEKFDVLIHYENGLVGTGRGIRIDMFSDEEKTVYMDDKWGNNFVDISFIPSDAVYNEGSQCYAVVPDKLTLHYMQDDDDIDEERKTAKIARSSKVKYVLLRRKMSKDIHYVL